MFRKLSLTTIATVCLAIAGCYNSNRQQAAGLADQIRTTMAATQPGVSDSSSPSTGSFGLGLADNVMPEGCYLRATIKGKRWEATGMTPDFTRSSLSVVNGRNKNGFLNFNINNRLAKVGKPREFRDTNAAMYWDENDEDWFGKSGSVTVNKIDERFIEGTFNFTAEENGKTVVCTNGEFRVPSPRAQPQ